MSNRRKNNHYHYAEKFEDRSRRSRRGKSAYMPFKSVIISLVVLLMFGLITTTFSVYVSDNDPDYNPEAPSLIMQARNLKASRDIALTGANAELAATSVNISNFWPIFDNSVGKWAGPNFYCLVGKSNWSHPYKLTNIPGTNLYGVTSAISFDGATQLCFIADDATWNDGEGKSPTDRRSYADNYSKVQTISSNPNGVYSASSSGSGNLTFTSQSNGYGYFNYKQTIQSYTSTTSNTNSAYSADNSGGLISFSAIELDGNASSTDSEDRSGYFNAAKTSSVTLTATANTGYRFVGWYNGNNTQITTDVSGNKYTYTVTGTNTIRARFIAQYTVTQEKIDLTADGGGSKSTTVDAGGNVELKASTPTGVTFSKWTITGTYSGGNTSSATTTIAPTSNVTATANYTLDKPTSLALSYKEFVAGGSSDAPTYSATSPAGGTLTYSFSKTDSSSTDYSVDADTGVVTASVPGTYSVTMTVKNEKYGLFSTDTKTASVIVRPAIPSPVSYEPHNYTGTYTAGTTGLTESNPIEVPIHSTTFDIQMWLPATISGYSYQWSVTNGSVTSKPDGSNQTITAANSAGSLINTNVTGTRYIEFYPIATYNSVSSLEPAAADKIRLYYKVTNEFLEIKDFAFSNGTDTSSQKIYSLESAPTKISYNANAGGTQFKTGLFFSDSNKTYEPMLIRDTMEAILSIAEPSVLAGKWNRTDSGSSDLVNPFDIRSEMLYPGVKYFRAYIADHNEKVTPAERGLHTTVGTSSTAGSQLLYFKDTTGETLSNTRLMAFFVDASGKLTYQTSEDFNVVSDSDRTNTYRFYVPSDAQYVSFAYAASNYYVLPTASVENGVYGINYGTDNTVFLAYTNLIELNSEANYRKTTYVADTRTKDGNDIYVYSNTGNDGNMTNLDINN